MSTTETTVTARWETQPQPTFETHRLLRLLFGDESEADAR